MLIGEQIIRKRTIFEETTEGIIDNLTTQDNGVAGHSRVGSIGTLKVKYDGVMGHSHVGSIGILTADGSGVTGHSHVGRIGTLTAGWSGVAGHSHVGRIGTLKVKYDGVTSHSHVGSIGILTAGCGVMGHSHVGRIGTLTAGCGVTGHSHVGRIGTLTAERSGVTGHSRVNLITGSVNVGRTLFYKSHFNRVVSPNVKAHTLDTAAYRSLVAADTIEATKNYGGINVITPQPFETDNQTDFVRYTGTDWENAKKNLRDLERTKALNFCRLTPDRVKKILGKEDISSVDELLQVEEELEKYMDGLSYDEIDKNIDYAIGFNNLPDALFAQVVKATTNTWQTHEKEAIREFGNLYSELDSGTQEKLLANLDSGKPEHKPSYDMVRIAKEFTDKYGVFIDDKNAALEGILTAQKDDNVLPDSSLQDFQDYGQLKKIYEKYQKELREVAALAELIGVNFTTKFEQIAKGRQGIIKHADGITALQDKDYSALENKFVEELRCKKREYTIAAITTAGKRIASELYKEVTGREIDVDDLSLEEISALRIYNKGKNKDAAQKLLIHKNDVYSLPRNKCWLEEKGIDLKKITNFTDEVEEIDAGDAIKRLKERKETLWNEMQDLLSRFNEGTNENYQANTVHDFRNLAKEVENPDKLSRDMQRLYTELTQEKPEEYETISRQKDGRETTVPTTLTVRVATALETIHMGDYFPDSCVAVDKVNGWTAPSYAIDVNKPVLYAYNQENRVVGRLSLGITEDKKVTRLSRVYSNSSANIEAALDAAAKDFANELGMDYDPNAKRVALLEAKKCYSDYDEKLLSAA